jgi:hypothetical protein
VAYVDPVAMEFKNSLGDLQRSADMGCHCCSFLRAALQASRPYDGGPIRLVRHTPLAKTYESLAIVDYITLNDGKSELAKFPICTNGRPTHVLTVCLVLIIHKN